MKRIYTLKTIVYISGIFITALGINMLLLSTLGAGAWDTVAYSFSKLVNITIGMASIIINMSVLGFVLAFRRKIKYLAILIPIVSLGFAIDFWGLLIFKDVVINQLGLQLLFFVLGGITLALGLATVLVSTFPAMVYEELTLLMMELLHIKQFFTTRILIELFAIALAIGLGLWANIGLGAVNLGSFLLAVALGPIISLHISWLSKVFKFKK